MQIYTKAQQAKKELLLRQQNSKLKSEIMAFVKELPPGFSSEPAAYLLRHIATSTNEDMTFSHLVENLDLKPMWFEYSSDIFVTINKGKLNYVKLPILINGIKRYVSIVDNVNYLHRAKPQLDQITTTQKDITDSSISLINLHHNLRDSVLPQYKKNYFDISDWFKSQAIRSGAQGTEKSLAKYYYPALMALFICHGILFEDFDNGPNSANLDKFKNDVLYPALQLVEDKFGLKPLIVHFSWKDEYGFYPTEIATLLKYPSTP